MKHSNMSLIGDALKAKRKALGLTQSSVAEQTAIQRQTISNIERGVFLGAIATLQRYMDFANLQISYIEKPARFPQMHELDALFGDDE